MTQKHVPFRYDYVGSFLRPEELKVAREKFQNNEITKEEMLAEFRKPYSFKQLSIHNQS